MPVPLGPAQTACPSSVAIGGPPAQGPLPGCPGREAIWVTAVVSGAPVWRGPGLPPSVGQEGRDLHRSFSSSVPLEVTDSAWMNSENSIRPS